MFMAKEFSRFSGPWVTNPDFRSAEKLFNYIFVDDNYYEYK